jgi:hypothetical protein
MILVWGIGLVEGGCCLGLWNLPQLLTSTRRKAQPLRTNGFLSPPRFPCLSIISKFHNFGFVDQQARVKSSNPMTAIFYSSDTKIVQWCWDSPYNLEGVREISVFHDRVWEAFVMLFFDWRSCFELHANLFGLLIRSIDAEDSEGSQPSRVDPKAQD